jgi:hypothetical protein
MHRDLDMSRDHSENPCLPVPASESTSARRLGADGDCLETHPTATLPAASELASGRLYWVSKTVAAHRGSRLDLAANLTRRPGGPVRADCHLTKCASAVMLTSWQAALSPVSP